MMTGPRVLNRRRDLIPADAVYIGRGSPYGNPFVVGIDGDRFQCVDLFETYVLPTLDLTALRGKDLVCYCAPKKCHGDVLLREANK